MEVTGGRCTMNRKKLFLCWFPVALLPGSNLVVAIVSAHAIKPSVAWVIGAIAEELFFRAFLLRHILLPRINSTNAIILSSVFFAGMHLFNLRAGTDFLLVLIQMFCAFDFSIWAGSVVCKTDETILPLLAHLLMNATASTDNLWICIIVSMVILADGILLIRDKNI